MTPKEAVDDINGILRDLGLNVHWEGVQRDRDQDDSAFVRFIIRHVGSEQKTMGPVGSRKFERTGFAVAQIFNPIGKGLSDSYISATNVNDAYEGKTSPNGVWFRNVRINEIGKEGDFFQTNVVIEFTYDEIK